jgi:hypothetical protein
VRSRTTPEFRKLLAALPDQVQEQARTAHERFAEDPQYPGLNFKRVGRTEGLHSVRVGLSYRALGVVRGGEIVWFWIGHHAEYDHLLKRI